MVKKFGHSHHPDTVTHHLNTANDGHNKYDVGVGYAPNYHGSGSAGDYHYPSPPAHVNHHYEPPTHVNNHEPSHAYGANHHYNQHNLHQPPPSTIYNHYEPQVPSTYNHYEPQVPSTYNHYQPQVPSTYNYYQPQAPETIDFQHGRPPIPLYAAGIIPTVHGDYGSSSPEEYYPAPLHFPSASHKYGDGGDDHNYDYKFPAADDHDDVVTASQVGSAERPEYLRKYFEPNYRSRIVTNNFYDDDESK